MTKRIIALAVSVFIFCGMFGALSASALETGDTVKLYTKAAINADGERYNHGIEGESGIAFIDINGRKNSAAWGWVDAIYVGSTNGPIAYCIEMGTPLGSGNYLAENVSFSDLWKEKLSQNARYYISLITMYGYPNNNYGAHWVDAYVATQCLIWEFSINFRIDADGGFNNPSGYSGNQIYNMTIKDTKAEIVYNKILNEIKNHKNIPSISSRSSLSAPTHTMAWNATANRCEYVVPTSQINGYKFTTLPVGVNVTTSGSNTIFYTKQEVTANSGVVTMKKDLPAPPQDLLVFNASNVQACITGTAEDPVAGYFKLQSELAGNIKIVKVSEDGEIANISFNIRGNGVDQNVVTNSKGETLIEDLRAGTYIITEQKYDKYVEVAAQTVTVKPNQTATVSFSNVLKKFNVQVQKKDSSSSDGKALGNGTLAGAVYGLYKNGVLQEEYTTDSNGTFTTKYFVCGTDWTIKEISPSEGYLLDTTVYNVGADPRLYTLESNTANNTVYEEAIKGKIALVKHMDEGETGIDTPEPNAKFEVYLQSAGSYENARDSEKTILTTNENGYAESGYLPYGAYVVHQIAGANGQQFVKDFTVDISENMETYRFILNNATYKARIRVEKRDSETGKLISPAEGSSVGFQIRKPDGELLTETLFYPEHVEIDTFYVNSEGWLMLPNTLPYSEKAYQLIEVETAHGYFLGNEIVDFYVQGQDDVITVTKKNSPQKGKFILEKEGEVFSSVSENDEIYQPEYSVTGLTGTVYNIIAEENIVLNGDLKHEKDSVIGTITTDESGIAEISGLYLGQYRAEEIKSSHGFVISENPIYFEITYAGQEYEETITEFSAFNERQKVLITLDKILEQDEVFGIGRNEEILSVSFGLYAKEDIFATDGTMIPKDGLIEIINVAENGKAVFLTDIPLGSKLYIKELSTDEHYILSNKVFEIQFEYAGQEVEIVNVFANDGEPIENKLIRGNISGQKVDEDGNGLGGAVIGLFKFDVTDFTNETAMLSEISNENGGFSFENVPFGKYIICEIESPVGFVLSKEIYTVAISEDKQLIEIEIKNKPITGFFELTKKDVSDGRLIPDCGVRIRDENGSIVVEGYTDKDGVITFELQYGKYTYQEFDAPEGYLLDETEFSFEITKHGEIVKATMTNEKKPTVPKTGDKFPLIPVFVSGGVVIVLIWVSILMKKER